MEYVVIRYTRRRVVRMDGQDAGFTNDTLMVEAGHHVFDLGEPPDYTPASVERVVQSTVSEDPLVISNFHPK